MDADESSKALLHPKKVIITVWWFMAGIIHYKVLNAGETITAEQYHAEIEVMHISYYTNRSRQWSTKKDPFCFMIMSNHMLN
uniref:Uncharacterized protein n=2 Tax=Parasteatoda tepidariorum TaxID=114398 RepID=A0A2L2YFV4_PARTP